MIAIRAMGTFDDPDVLRKAFDLALGDELKLSEWRYLFGSAIGSPRRAAGALRVGERELGKDTGARAELRGPGDGRRRRHGVHDGRARRRAGVLRGGDPGHGGREAPARQALESAGLCIALRQHGAAGSLRVLATKIRGDEERSNVAVADVTRKSLNERAHLRVIRDHVWGRAELLEHASARRADGGDDDGAAKGVRKRRTKPPRFRDPEQVSSLRLGREHDRADISGDNGPDEIPEGPDVPGQGPGVRL